MDNQNENNTETMTQEDVVNSFMEFYNSFTFMCPQCAHENVCSKKGNTEIPCKDFLVNGNYKRYGNINDLFQPIFDWIQYHYPSGEVIFIVDKNSAKMHLEHGVNAYSKEIYGFANPVPQKLDSEEGKSKSE